MQTIDMNYSAPAMDMYVPDGESFEQYLDIKTLDSALKGKKNAAAIVHGRYAHKIRDRLEDLQNIDMSAVSTDEKHVVVDKLEDIALNATYTRDKNSAIELLNSIQGTEYTTGSDVREAQKQRFDDYLTNEMHNMRHGRQNLIAAVSGKYDRNWDSRLDAISKQIRNMRSDPSSDETDFVQITYVKDFLEKELNTGYLKKKSEKDVAFKTKAEDVVKDVNKFIDEDLSAGNPKDYIAPVMKALSGNDLKAAKINKAAMSAGLAAGLMFAPAISWNLDSVGYHIGELMQDTAMYLADAVGDISLFPAAYGDEAVDKDKTHIKKAAKRARKNVYDRNKEDLTNIKDSVEKDTNKFKKNVDRLKALGDKKKGKKKDDKPLDDRVADQPARSVTVPPRADGRGGYTTKEPAKSTEYAGDKKKPADYAADKDKSKEPAGETTSTPPAYSRKDKARKERIAAAEESKLEKKAKEAKPAKEKFRDEEYTSAVDMLYNKKTDAKLIDFLNFETDYRSTGINKDNANEGRMIKARKKAEKDMTNAREGSWYDGTSKVTQRETEELLTSYNQEIRSLAYVLHRNFARKDTLGRQKRNQATIYLEYMLDDIQQMQNILLDNPELVKKMQILPVSYAKKQKGKKGFTNFKGERFAPRYTYDQLFNGWSAVYKKLFDRFDKIFTDSTTEDLAKHKKRGDDRNTAFATWKSSQEAKKDDKNSAKIDESINKRKLKVDNQNLQDVIAAEKLNPLGDSVRRDFPAAFDIGMDNIDKSQLAVNQDKYGTLKDGKSAKLEGLLFDREIKITGDDGKTKKDADGKAVTQKVTMTEKRADALRELYKDKLRLEHANVLKDLANKAGWNFTTDYFTRSLKHLNEIFEAYKAESRPSVISHAQTKYDGKLSEANKAGNSIDARAAELTAKTFERKVRKRGFKGAGTEASGFIFDFFNIFRHFSNWKNGTSRKGQPNAIQAAIEKSLDNREIWNDRVAESLDDIALVDPKVKPKDENDQSNLFVYAVPSGAGIAFTNTPLGDKEGNSLVPQYQKMTLDQAKAIIRDAHKKNMKIKSDGVEVVAEGMQETGIINTVTLGKTNFAGKSYSVIPKGSNKEGWFAGLKALLTLGSYAGLGYGISAAVSSGKPAAVVRPPTDNNFTPPNITEGDDVASMITSK